MKLNHKNHWPNPRTPATWSADLDPAIFESANVDMFSVALQEALSILDTLEVVHIYDPEYPKGGMTVAYRKSGQYKSGVMVEVAVQVCSDSDSFSKKIGNVGAKRRFLNGETIHLPILKNFYPEDIGFAVKQAFTALNDAI